MQKSDFCVYLEALKTTVPYHSILLAIFVRYLFHTYIEVINLHNIILERSIVFKVIPVLCVFYTFILSLPLKLKTVVKQEKCIFLAYPQVYVSTIHLQKRCLTASQ